MIQYKTAHNHQAVLATARLFSRVLSPTTWANRECCGYTLAISLWVMLPEGLPKGKGPPDFPTAPALSSPLPTDLVVLLPMWAIISISWKSDQCLCKTVGSTCLHKHCWQERKGGGPRSGWLRNSSSPSPAAAGLSWRQNQTRIATAHCQLVWQACSSHLHELWAAPNTFLVSITMFSQFLCELGLYPSERKIKQNIWATGELLLGRAKPQPERSGTVQPEAFSTLVHAKPPQLISTHRPAALQQSTLCPLSALRCHSRPSTTPSWVLAQMLAKLYWHNNKVWWSDGANCHRSQHPGRKVGRLLWQHRGLTLTLHKHLKVACW